MIASGFAVGWPLPLTFLTFVKPFAFRKTCHSFNSHFRAARYQVCPLLTHLWDSHLAFFLIVLCTPSAPACQAEGDLGWLER